MRSELTDYEQAAVRALLPKPPGVPRGPRTSERSRMSPGEVG